MHCHLIFLNKKDHKAPPKTLAANWPSTTSGMKDPKAISGKIKESTAEAAVLLTFDFTNHFLLISAW